MAEPRPYRGLTKKGKRVKGNHIFLRHEHDRESHFIQEIDAVWISKPDYNRGWSHNKYEVIPETVGQSTDLRDKKRTEEFPAGQEIYDGDIYKDAKGIVSKVEMAVDGWALFPINGKSPIRSLYWINICDKTKGEVIGSAHDHLLKGAE